MGAKKILVVDDEKECCQMLSDFFTRRECYVDVAYDGLKAKALLDEEVYDVIFFDCVMPGLSGVELIKVIREKCPGARKILMSGYALVREDLADYLGVDVFLRKPFSLREVEEVLFSE
jgi:DNA-binding response OmpR family regulator